MNRISRWRTLSEHRFAPSLIDRYGSDSEDDIGMDKFRFWTDCVEEVGVRDWLTALPDG